jgi:hypothetical protein
MSDPITVSGSKSLEDCNTVWEVSIDGANRGTSALGHHRSGEKFIAHVVDGVTRGVKKCIDPSRAARLNGFNPNRDRRCRCGNAS